MNFFARCALGMGMGSALLYAQSSAQLPTATGRDNMKKVCSGCHPAEVVLGKGMSREQWGGIVSNMISRGAKGSEEEFAQVVDYLAINLPLQTISTAVSTAPAPTAPRRRAPTGGGLLAQAGPSDKHIVDEEGAARGKTIYIAQCITCHGQKARGTNRGPDIVRSLVVLDDRYGDTLGPYLQKGHPTQSGVASASFTSAQIQDLSDFMHQKVGDTLRTGPYNSVLNVLTGDPKAGEAYFKGEGRCSTCHSTTGDLAGIATKYDPPVLQLKVVFPQTPAFGRRAAPTAKRKPVTVTVTPAGGQSLSGTLLQIDDFNVSLRDAGGEFHTIVRSPDVKVEKHDPYEAHVALLDRYSDKNIHDVVAFLETFK